MSRKKRKVPLRKCIITQEMRPKGELIRIVRTKEGEVFVDPTGKKNGRGAYLSKELSIIEEAEKNKAIDKQFGLHVDPSIYKELKEMVTKD